VITVAAKLPVPEPVTPPVKVIVWSPVLVPEMVEFPVMVRVLAASPMSIVRVLPAVNTVAVAKVRSKAAPVERMPRPVIAVWVPPAMAGAVFITKVLPVPV
jgi:hypothetical protein